MSHKFVYNRVGWHFKWCKGEFKELDNHIFEDGNLMAIFFGADGGPIPEDLQEIQDKQDQIDVKKAELAVLLANRPPHNVQGIANVEREIRILTAQLNQLITNQGGTFLDQEPGLDN